MHVNDLDQIKDAELYDRLLNEFPRWLTKARGQGILAAPISDAVTPRT